jgi:exodeoxyribonuclease VII small subunit
MPKAPASKAPPAEPASYEAALEELEQLVGRIESGQLPLDQMLAGYQRGATLLAFCRTGWMRCRTRSRCWTKASASHGRRNERPP